MQEKNFSDIDPNFKQKNEVGSSLHYYNVTDGPIILEGLPFTNEDGRRSRLPLKTAEMMRGHVTGPAMQTT